MDNVVGNQQKSPIKKIDEYQQKGYTGTYQMKGDQLLDLDTKNTYNSEDVTIIDEYRFEGMTNPDDMSILYIIELTDGSKGTALIPYGPEGDSDLGAFFAQVSVYNKDKTDLNKV